MPVSISRISFSRSWIRDSWYASSCGESWDCRIWACRCSWGVGSGSLGFLNKCQNQKDISSLWRIDIMTMYDGWFCSSSTANLTPCTTVLWRSALTCCARWNATKDIWRSWEVFWSAVFWCGFLGTTQVSLPVNLFIPVGSPMTFVKPKASLDPRNLV